MGEGDGCVRGWGGGGVVGVEGVEGVDMVEQREIYAVDRGLR